MHASPFANEIALGAGGAKGRDDAALITYIGGSPETAQIALTLCLPALGQQDNASLPLSHDGGPNALQPGQTLSIAAGAGRAPIDTPGKLNIMHDHAPLHVHCCWSDNKSSSGTLRVSVATFFRSQKSSKPPFIIPTPDRQPGVVTI